MTLHLWPILLRCLLTPRSIHLKNTHPLGPSSWFTVLQSLFSIWGFKIFLKFYLCLINLFILIGDGFLYNIVVVFVIHWHESTTGTHMPPCPEPPSHLPHHPNPLKNLEIELPYDPAIPLLGIHTKETRIERDTCTPMHGHGSNLDVHRQMNWNGSYSTYTQWNITQPL